MAGSATEPDVIPVRFEVDTGHIERARAKLTEAEAALRGLTQGAKVPTAIDVQTDEARASVRALKDEIKALEKARRDADRLALQGYKFQKAAEAAAAKGAEKGGEGMTLGSQAIIGAARYLGEKGVDFALSGAKWAASIVKGAVTMGIEGTASRQKNIAILDRLTKGQGELAESVSKQLAGETGVGEEKAMERVKALIQARFDRADTEMVFRASAEIGEVKGQGKADAFLEILEKVQFEGKVTEKALKGLASAGVEKSALLEQLQQTGETTEQVEARLKSGGVAAKDFARAAAAAVQKDIGGVAGKGLDAMFNRAKIAAGDLFDGMDEGVGALEGLGNIVIGALSGADGAKLKESISAAGNEVLKLAKNVTAADVKTLFDAAAGAATTMAAGIKAAAGAAAELWNITKQVSGKGGHVEEDTGSWFGGGTDEAIVEEINAGNRRAAIREMEAEKIKAAAEKAKAAAAAGPGEASGQAAAGGYVTGKAYADGFSKGVDENAGKAAAAGAALVGGAVKAGAAAQKSHSPSEVMAEKGENYVEGYEIGIRRTAGRAASAGSDMVGRTVRAAGGGAGGGAGAAAGAASSIILQVYQTLPPGSPEATRAAARAGAEQAYPAFLAALRQAGRDGALIRSPNASG